MQPSFLIVGLGNPGDEYKNNRHNIGFLALDALMTCAHATAPTRKFKGEIAFGSLGNEACAFLKPMTFMNLSGEAVGEVARFYKIPAEKIIVLHDDMDLLPGRIKAKQGGGSGGHNGLKSIDAHMGANYWRVRFGVGHPAERAEVVSYVLGNFSKKDKEALADLFQAVADAFPFLFQGDVSRFLQKIPPSVTDPR